MEKVFLFLPRLVLGVNPCESGYKWLECAYRDGSGQHYTERYYKILTAKRMEVEYFREINQAINFGSFGQLQTE